MEQPERYIPALGYPWLTRFYDFVTKILMPRNFRQPLVNMLNPRNEEKILDFGTGTAETALLIKKANPKTTVIGIDIDDKILAIAKAKVIKSNAEISLCRNYNHSLPFDDGYFDKIVCCLVVCNMQVDKKIVALQELKRVLKPDGFICLAEWKPNSEGLKYLIIKAINNFTPVSKATSQNKTPITTYLKEAGFKNISEVSYKETVSGNLGYFQAYN